MDSISSVASRILLKASSRVKTNEDVMELIHVARQVEMKNRILQGQVHELVFQLHKLQDENKFLLSQINEDVNHAAKDV